MSPENRILYETAKHRHPNVYEMLLNLDAQLAELHAAGMALQRNRMEILKNLATQRQYIARAPIIVTERRQDDEFDDNIQGSSR